MTGHDLDELLRGLGADAERGAAPLDPAHVRRLGTGAGTAARPPPPSSPRSSSCWPAGACSASCPGRTARPRPRWPPRSPRPSPRHPRRPRARSAPSARRSCCAPRTCRPAAGRRWRWPPPAPAGSPTRSPRASPTGSAPLRATGQRGPGLPLPGPGAGRGADARAAVRRRRRGAGGRAGRRRLGGRLRRHPGGRTGTPCSTPPGSPCGSTWPPPAAPPGRSPWCPIYTQQGGESDEEGFFESLGVTRVDDRLMLTVEVVRGMDDNVSLQPGGDPDNGMPEHPQFGLVRAAAERLAG